jgi:L-lactate dehydrogenase complex protein LldF
MAELYKQFLKDAENIVFDVEHRKKIKFNISKYNKAHEEGKHQFSRLELARQRAANIKHRSISNLDKYLIEFEINFTNRGGKIIWAQNKKEATREILNILKKARVTSVVKSKSMISEELDLNDALEKKKIEPIETDLGEYIVQLAGEKPYHIVTPAMHKSKEDIAKLFHEKFNTPEDATPEENTAFVRKHLRQEFIKADAGITGANFLLADTGAICLTENEGNGLMSLSFPRIHIVIAGIEKIIPSINDLELYWPLLSTYGTGQKITAYNSIVSGPRQEGESDGPDEMYVVLLDNGRTDVLKQERQRRALSCIRCGACLNACPVYRNIGGYTYNTTYSGPIGAVINPYLKGLRDYKHLSYASSICGKCTEVCPVNIPLHELLLVNRNDAVKKGMVSSKEKIIYKSMRKALMSRKMMNIGGGMKNTMARMMFSKTWGPRRDLPEINAKSFNKLWKETRL